ncbi:MAG: TIGR03118 family protein [Pseudomonadota bacterium]
MKMHRKLAALLGGAALAAGLVACGGGYGGGNDGYHPPPAVATKFAATALVSDGAIAASHTDAKLVNPWGLAFNPTGYVWVANNGTDSSTLYDGNGVPQSLVVTTPAGPTGIVYNGSQDFMVTQNAISGPSRFIFVTQAGTLSGWSPAVNQNAALTVVPAGGPTGPLYQGLAIGAYAGANYLYAADFRHNAVDVYNATFTKVTLPGVFHDMALPAGYAPFGIQGIADRIYVAYAKQDASGSEEVTGAGLGIINVFDSGGVFIKRLVTGGALNAPWGMALAPGNFGSFSGDLLVANFGDGKINAYRPSGHLDGTLSKTDGTPIAIDGLWGIAFGNGINAQPRNTLFYTAGPQDEAHGVYGRIDMQ